MLQALSSFLLFGSAGACATLCLAVGALAVATYALLGIVAVAGEALHLHRNACDLVYAKYALP